MLTFGKYLLLQIEDVETHRHIEMLKGNNALLTRAVESLLHVTSTSIVGCKSKP